MEPELLSSEDPQASLLAPAPAPVMSAPEPAASQVSPEPEPELMSVAPTGGALDMTTATFDQLQEATWEKDLRKAKATRAVTKANILQTAKLREDSVQPVPPTPQAPVAEVMTPESADQLSLDIFRQELKQQRAERDRGVERENFMLAEFNREKDAIAERRRGFEQEIKVETARPVDPTRVQKHMTWASILLGSLGDGLSGTHRFADGVDNLIQRDIDAQKIMKSDRLRALTEQMGSEDAALKVMKAQSYQQLAHAITAKAEAEALQQQEGSSIDIFKKRLTLKAYEASNAALGERQKRAYEAGVRAEEFGYKMALQRAEVSGQLAVQRAGQKGDETYRGPLDDMGIRLQGDFETMVKNNMATSVDDARAQYREANKKLEPMARSSAQKLGVVERQLGNAEIWTDVFGKAKQEISPDTEAGQAFKQSIKSLGQDLQHLKSGANAPEKEVLENLDQLLGKGDKHSILTGLRLAEALVDSHYDRAAGGAPALKRPMRREALLNPTPMNPRPLGYVEEYERKAPPAPKRVDPNETPVVDTGF